MNGHPALAFVVVELFNLRRGERHADQPNPSLARSRGLRLGRHRRTITREGRGVQGTM